MKDVLGQHVGSEGVERVEAIERSIWRTFQAMPKNAAGRLAPRSVRHVVQKYFSKEHGWRILGLEPHGMQDSVSEVHEMSILRERAPALLKAMLEDRAHGRGLAFEDIVMMISALESLILSETLQLLRTAYRLNGLDDTHEVNIGGVHEVLRSFLLLFRMGAAADSHTKEIHMHYKERMEALSPAWKDIVEYASDTLFNVLYASRDKTNPFEKKWFKFEDVAIVVQKLAHGYGRWQDGDCRAMKETLVNLSVVNNGRVPLDRFYSQPDSAAYHFHEKVSYLQSVGALEEVKGGARQVRIPNYVQGPTNCIARSAYYSVCCMNECEVLMHELEGAIQAPQASVEQLLRLVGELDTPTVDSPRIVGETLVAKLKAIAKRHGGAVPLHGRLFAQWMHFAFPNECPFPEQVASNALLPQHWKDKGSVVADEEEQSMEAGLSYEDLAPAMAEWSDDEVLMLYEAEAPSGASLLRIVFNIVLVGVVLQAAYTGWQSAVRALSGRSDEKSFGAFV
jgi:hypothetical protein